MKNTIANIRKALPSVLYPVAVALALLLVPGDAAAQTPQALFQSANQDYQKGDYRQAGEKYDSLLRLGYRSAELYNNLGNSYYRLGYIAPTLLAYERAALLAPADDEIAHNLDMARRLTSDNIVPLGESLSQKVFEFIGSLFSIDTWSILALVFAWSAFGLFVLFLYNLRPNVKRWAFYGFAITLVFCILSYGLRRREENSIRENPYAIVTASNVTARSEPSVSGGEIFSIHEGTKVRMEQTLDQWDKIRLADGKIGWIPAGSAEKI